MENKEYWEKRQIALWKQVEKKEKRTLEKLVKDYIRMGKQLEKEIAYYYQRYGLDNVLEYRKMVQSLSNSEREMLFRNFDKFAVNHPEYAYLQPIRESIYKLNRLEGLQLAIYLKQAELGVIEQQLIEELLSQVYKTGYMSTLKYLPNVPVLFGISDEILRQTIYQKWVNGENFSDRIWFNKRKLINFIRNYMRDALIRGDSYAKIIKMLRGRLQVSMSDAKRLITTESAFVLNQANRQAFIDAGIKKYQITAVLDNKTSKTCRGLNGETFEYGKDIVGVTYPPFHSYCRTTVIPIEN
ncbi:minor capsid protein [Paenibacillus larvae]|uniref:Minor capsid protein n=2 Tax=Paenibacillus larvae TaxID=1464 RepID=A0AAP5MZE1_9BACL|nr:minor capsid protein [Paenibacillus larvae]MCY7476047.1 minor capsid protein [Paenibacillus larvae]MCY7490121.1 minor capsid protein [Paenibacillus larvae]MCY9561710.1 minor capsid protein [Paenibacillus larvae]MCY9566143.1 minor capsid protein [Paenibacillus larvae]MCY9573859.1 minor capsid protein [Paenibacillus larvae]